MIVGETDNNAKIEHKKGRWIMQMGVSVAGIDIVGDVIATAIAWIV